MGKKKKNMSAIKSFNDKIQMIKVFVLIRGGY